MPWQPPKGTRDFYPGQMAWRNHLIDAWRRVSVRHGFEQVDGPIFEHLDLYKVKSGEGIVSELFSFRREGGETDYALRPEFTPTLARMVAARAQSLPKPIKWFATPNFCRAENPQRGRLREFWQWNVDMLGLGGGDGPRADAEVLLVAIDLLEELGLEPGQVRVKLSHRDAVGHILRKLEVGPDMVGEAFDLLDRRGKMSEEQFREGASKLGLDEARVQRFDQICRMKYPAGDDEGGLAKMREQLGLADELEPLAALDAELRGFGIADWCEYDLGIVRGLAYYTGTVFELHEVSGMERALAGGGRYDRLIELFDGPATPAVGFGMGDVVLTNVLQDKALVPEDVAHRPDAFLIAASDAGAARLPRLAADLRRGGLHVRFSYRATRNVGKLLKEADTHRARRAVILGDAVEGGIVEVKDLDGGEQREVAVAELAAALHAP